MANQAIALQARAPQNDFLGRAIQQNAQMMNMMSQQRAAERQAAAQQQEMKLAQEKAGREATQAEIDNAGKLIDLYTKRAGQTLNAEGYGLLLRDMDRDAPEIAAAFRANLPPERFDRNVLLQMVGSIGDNFKATFGPLETEVVQMEDGTFAVARTGGFGKPGVFELEEFQLQPGGSPAPSGAPAQNPMSAPRATAPATDAQIDEAARAIIGGAGVQDGPLRGLSMEDFDRATERANQMTAGGGGRMQPISMTTGAQMGGQPDMTAVVQDMMSSGQISQSNLQLMREMAGPDKDAQLAQILKANNIRIVPDEQPGMRSAVFRPGQDAAPQMQLAQSMEDYRPTGRAARGKPPLQSPSQAPGAAGAVSGATTAASEGVRVRTQPKIVAGEERVKRVEKLRGELPLARSETQTLIDNLDRRIDAIDRFLRNPYRSSIIGAIEGRIPKMLQTPTRADVQALYDTIVSNTVLNKLIEDRQATETGASPQGIVSDRDLAVAAQASNSLTQTGTERQQEIEMQRLRNILYQTRQRALEKYNTVYREVLSEAPDLRLQVPSIAPKYQSKPTKAQPQRGGISPDVAKKYGL
jgi:hypothetical protein